MSPNLSHSTLNVVSPHNSRKHLPSFSFGAISSVGSLFNFPHDSSSHGSTEAHTWVDQKCRK